MVPALPSDCANAGASKQKESGEGFYSIEKYGVRVHRTRIYRFHEYERLSEQSVTFKSRAGPEFAISGPHF